MQLAEAQQQFIEIWGTLSSQWGISRTMAQIHALLMIRHEPMSAEDVMQELQISRGNANQNLRALMDWGLVYKHLRPGQRKEFFVAEKDIWQIARQITRERRRRELEPVQEMLEDIKNVEGKDAETRAFRTFAHELSDFIATLDKVSEIALRMEKSSFLKTLVRFFPKTERQDPAQRRRNLPEVVQES